MSNFWVGKEWRPLVDDLRRAGCTLERTGSGHIRVTKDGAMVTVIPATSSDHRAIKNARALLRRKGVLDGEDD